MRARVVYSLLFVTVLVVFSESFCFASSTTTKNTAVSQALQRGRRRYLLEEKPTASDARIHLHRSLFIPPKEGEEEKEKGEKETQKSENEWRGAETKTLANLLELEQKYGKMMSDFSRTERRRHVVGGSRSNRRRVSSGVEGTPRRVGTGEEHAGKGRAVIEIVVTIDVVMIAMSTIPRNNENIDLNDRATRERFLKLERGKRTTS